MSDTPPQPTRSAALLSPSLDAEFRPVSRRRRLLILLLAVSLVLSVLYLMLGRRGSLFLTTEVARCGPGQTEHCVGGLAEAYVVIAAPASAASAASAAASAASATASAASASASTPR